MQNNEQIKPIEDELDVNAVVEEMDPEEAAMMDEYLNIIEEVRKRPDAELKLKQIRGTIKIIAGSPPETGADEKRESEKRAWVKKCDQAADELANAFATLERCRKFLPGDFCSRFDDALSSLLDDSDWTSDPEVMSEVLPHILRRAFWNNRPDRLT